jgi:hypothetical protein
MFFSDILISSHVKSHQALGIRVRGCLSVKDVLAIGTSKMSSFLREILSYSHTPLGYSHTPFSSATYGQYNNV